jgi:FG-GAP-like repeat
MVVQAVKGRPGSFGAAGSAVLLACVGVALALGVVASSAPAPAPSFAVPKEYATGDGPDALASGDLNGDGKLDVVTANDKTISVLLNRGDGSFQARRNYRAPGSHPAIGDLNGDRKLDLATANGLLRGAVSVLLNRGAGRFRAKRDYRKGDGPGADAIAIGDLDGDRKLDLVTTNEENTVSVLLNRGGGRFRAKRDYRTGPAPIALAIGDLNGDDKLDLVTPNLNSIDAGPPTVSVLLNRGNGRFRAKRDYRTGGIYSVAIGDLNGDRQLDLVTGDGGGFVSVLLNRGDGSFQAELDYRTQAKLVLRSAGGEWVAIGDLNGDGKVDLATSNMDDDTVSVLINTPGLCVVQEVRRMTLPVATRTLERVNCHVGEVGSDYSEAFKRGSRDVAEAGARRGAAERRQSRPRCQPWAKAVAGRAARCGERSH